MATTPGGTYYAASSELVSSWPATSLNLANQLESRFANKKFGQVVSTFKSGSFSTNSTSFTDVTGLSATLTPSASSSKVLVFVSLNGVANNTNGNAVAFNLVRASTNIAQSTGASTANQTFAVYVTETLISHPASLVYIDEPATTSSTTYKIQMRTAGGTAYLGYGVGNGSWGSVNTITVVEVFA